jgi:hypothetical protein
MKCEGHKVGIFIPAPPFFMKDLNQHQYLLGRQVLLTGHHYWSNQEEADPSNRADVNSAQGNPIITYGHQSHGRSRHRVHPPYSAAHPTPA